MTGSATTSSTRLRRESRESLAQWLMLARAQFKPLPTRKCLLTFSLWPWLRLVFLSVQSSLARCLRKQVQQMQRCNPSGERHLMKQTQRHPSLPLLESKIKIEYLHVAAPLLFALSLTAASSSSHPSSSYPPPFERSELLSPLSGLSDGFPAQHGATSSWGAFLQRLLKK